MEFVNCPNCDEIYVKNQFRDLCPKCWKKEEAEYDIVSKFLRRRENRVATISQIVEQTGVKEETILRFVKKGRLSPKQFPNLGYPCDRCGHIITNGMLCEKCAKELKRDLDIFHKEEQRKQEFHKRTYLSKSTKDSR